MNNNYQIENMLDEEVPFINEINNVVEYTLKYENVNDSVLSIVFVSEDYIKELNKTYRFKDSVTDVISFAFEDNAENVDFGIRMLGDIFICLDRAKEQANEYGHSLKREITFLCVHGLLHLLGYDHMNEDDEKIMFELQEVILGEYEKE